MISGDHERTALDFQKHYRLDTVLLMDTDLSFQVVHSRGGWPFLMLVDPDGNVVHKANSLIERETRMLRTLGQMKAASRAAPLKVVDGIRYSAETLRRSGELDQRRVCERFSQLAAAPDGRVFLVFTSSRADGGDVWLRVWDGRAWSENRAVAASPADEYDGTVIVARDNQVWFCWTSNAGADRYNILATSLDRLAEGKGPIQVTQSRDDAMGARMALDAAGTLWLTYYQWQKNTQGISRDKEIFVRTLTDGTLSKEVRVSPADVPSYEDHTDPAIACLGDRMLIAWSWDYHRPKGYTREPESPSIFLCALDANLRAAKPFHASARAIDMVPVLAAQGQTAWCAWDSLARKGVRYSKTLFVRRVDATGCVEKPVSIATDLQHLCSPCFAVGPKGQAVLVWCQKKRGGDWELWRSDADERGRWSEAQSLIDKGSPRYCSAVFDARGALWVSYTVATADGRQVKVEQVE